MIMMIQQHEISSHHHSILSLHYSNSASNKLHTAMTGWLLTFNTLTPLQLILPFFIGSSIVVIVDGVGLIVVVQLFGEAYLHVDELI